MLTVSELIKLLRQSLDISVSGDKAYLEMSDSDLTLYLKLSASKDYDIDSLDDLPNGSEYPLILLTEIELYKKLAVSTADFIDMGVDNNNYLKRSQRFSHYMALAEATQNQYDEYVSTGGSTGGVQTYTTRLKSNHMSQSDYELTPTPKVSIKAIPSLSDTILISWGVSGSSHFGRYKVYVSESRIVDIYADGSRAEDKILDGATLIKSTSDMRDNTHRITGLKPETKYYIAVMSIEKNGVYGYSETNTTTPSEIPEEPDINVGELPSGGGGDDIVTDVEIGTKPPNEE